MTNLAVTAQKVRPLDGSLLRRCILGGTVALGDTVYISDANGEIPIVQRADANGSAETARMRGVLASLQGGKTTGATGDAGAFVTFGPVAGFSDLTPGAQGYVSNDAGKIEDAVGAFDRFAGYCESETVFFVAPVLSDAAS